MKIYIFIKNYRPYAYALAGSAVSLLIGLLSGLSAFTTLGLIGIFAAGGVLYVKQIDTKNNTGASPVSQDAPAAQPAPAVSLDSSAAQPDLELAGGRQTWIRGVSNYQNEIRKVGKGAHTFLFMAEPNNKFDNLAVMVCAQLGNRQIKVGYLPAGTETTIAIHQYARHLEKSGQYISGPGVIENGDVGLVARVQTPDGSAVRDSLRSIQRDNAIASGTFKSITTSGPQPDLATEFFPKMEIKNEREFAENLFQFRTERGNHVVWYLLIPVSDDAIDVHISFPGEFPGPQVGRIAKRHMQWAKGYTHKGPICGRGFLRVDDDGSVAPVLGDPDWK